MVDAAIQTEKITLDEFTHLYETEGAFEIIRGERIQLMLPVSLHGAISKRPVTILLAFEAQGIGEVFYEMHFVLLDESDWVKASLVPDVMFFAAERLQKYRKEMSNWEEKPFVLVPDLATEIVSKNDSYSDINDKVQLYLQDGVRLVWVIDPKRQQVTVYAPGTPTQFLSADDNLNGVDFIPGFEMSVASLF